MADKVQLKINIPADVKNWLEAQARQNLRSQTAEVIVALREKIARETENETASARS